MKWVITKTSVQTICVKLLQQNNLETSKQFSPVEIAVGRVYAGKLQVVDRHTI